MISQTNLTAASGLALLSSYGTSQATNSSSAPSTSSQTSSAAALPLGNGPWVTITYQASYKGVTESVVEHQFNQSESAQAAATEQSALQYASDVQGSYATMEQNASLSSQQISNALYSGGGLTDPESPNTTDTWASFIASQYSTANFIDKTATNVGNWLAAGRPDTSPSSGTVSSQSFAGMSDAQVQQEVQSLHAQADSFRQLYSSMDAAFKNGSLTLQNALDVSGLNYSDTTTQNENGTFGTGTEAVSYNQSMVSGPDGQPTSDGKTHSIIYIGDTALYASW